MKFTKILSLIAVLAAFAVTTVSVPAQAEGGARKHKKKSSHRFRRLHCMGFPNRMLLVLRLSVMQALTLSATIWRLSLRRF